MTAAETIAAFTDYHTGSQHGLIKKLREGGLSDEHIAVCLDAIESTCNACWHGDKCYCYCTRDD